MVAKSNDFVRARKIDSDHLATPIITANAAINHIVGNHAHLIVRPDDDAPGGTEFKTLVIFIESGSFRFKPGQADTDFTTAPPAATTYGTANDGHGGVLLKSADGLIFTFAAPSMFSVVGSGASDVLTYWWA